MAYHTETAGDLILPFMVIIRSCLESGGNPDSIARGMKRHASETFCKVTEEEIALAIRCAVKRG